MRYQQEKKQIDYAKKYFTMGNVEDYFRLGKARIFDGQQVTVKDTQELSMVPKHKSAVNRVRLVHDKTFMNVVINDGSDNFADETKHGIFEKNKWISVGDGAKTFGWFMYHEGKQAYALRTYKKPFEVFLIREYDGIKFNTVKLETIVKTLVEKAYLSGSVKGSTKPFIDWTEVFKHLPKNIWYRSMMTRQDHEIEYREQLTERINLVNENYMNFLSIILFGNEELEDYELQIDDTEEIEDYE